MSLPERTVTAKARGGRIPYLLQDGHLTLKGSKGKPQGRRISTQKRRQRCSKQQHVWRQSVDARDTQTPGRPKEKLGSRPSWAGARI